MGAEPRSGLIGASLDREHIEGIEETGNRRQRPTDPTKADRLREGKYNNPQPRLNNSKMKWQAML